MTSFPLAPSASAALSFLFPEPITCLWICCPHFPGHSSSNILTVAPALPSCLCSRTSSQRGLPRPSLLCRRQCYPHGHSLCPFPVMTPHPLSHCVVCLLSVTLSTGMFTPRGKGLCFLLTVLSPALELLYCLFHSRNRINNFWMSKLMNKYRTFFSFSGECWWFCEMKAQDIYWSALDSF